MEKSKIKTIAITVIWILAAICSGLLFATFFQGCYAGEDQHNWIEIEDAGAEAEPTGVVGLKNPSYPRPTIDCEAIAEHIDSVSEDFCEQCQFYMSIGCYQYVAGTPCFQDCDITQ